MSEIQRHRVALARIGLAYVFVSATTLLAVLR